ncbi:MAG TPA: hypothetical protein VFE78_20245, partial [Gemmataceae bacterium]|nr:hypothetical protein [Gemmataceae bacterium]
MRTLLEFGLTNALAAGLLALLALAAGRYGRRPALVHSLWLLVLLKLVTPPLVRLPLPWPAAAAPAPAVLPAPEAAEFAFVAAPPAAGKVVESRTGSKVNLARLATDGDPFPPPKPEDLKAPRDKAVAPAPAPAPRARRSASAGAAPAAAGPL